MTDVDVDKVFAELKLTKTGYANLKVRPPTDKNSHWYKALAELGVIAGPPPPPPPPPSSAAFGSAVLAAFPWVQTLYDAALRTPNQLASGGTFPRLTKVGSSSSVWVVDGQGKQYGPTAVSARGARWCVMQRFKRTGTGTGDPDAGTGDDDGFNWQDVDHFMWRLIEGHDLHNTVKTQGISGAAKLSAVLGAVFTDITSPGDQANRSHPIYLSSGFEEVLVAAVYAEAYSGYGLHLYPGSGRLFRATHVTLLDSLARSGGLVSGDNGAITDVEVHNAIIGGHAVEAWRCNTLPKSRIFDSCLFDNPKIGSNVELIRCTTGLDPQLDAAGRPQNADVLKMGDPAWRVPHDCRGVPITRSIGAVAV